MSNPQALVDQLIENHGPAGSHPNGTLFVTEQCTCKSNAGYYIGTWCIEALSGQWLPQPYSRDSGYILTEALAQEYMK